LLREKAKHLACKSVPANRSISIRRSGPSRCAAFVHSEIAETVEGLLANGDVTVKNFVLEEMNMFLKIISNELWDVESVTIARSPRSTKQASGQPS
jgi:hypothetical protein